MKYFQSKPNKVSKVTENAPINEDEDEIVDLLENGSDESSPDMDMDDWGKEDPEFYDDLEIIQEKDGSKSDGEFDEESDEESDQDISGFIEEISDSEQNAPRKRRKILAMESKAKSLGYTGSFFKDGHSDFAPMEEFEFAVSDPESI